MFMERFPLLTHIVNSAITALTGEPMGQGSDPTSGSFALSSR